MDFKNIFHHHGKQQQITELLTTAPSQRTRTTQQRTKPVTDTTEKTPEQKTEQARKISIIEGSAYSVQDSFGSRYLTPYALALGASSSQIGILTSLSALFGTFIQLTAFKLMHKFTRKTLIFISVFTQAVIWLFLLGVGKMFFDGKISAVLASSLVIGIYIFFAVIDSFINPVWTSWTRDIIIAKEAGSYLGRRSRILGIVALISVVIAGFILEYFKKIYVFYGFAILFTIAFLARLTSSVLFLFEYEPEFKPDDSQYFSFVQFVKKMFSNNFGRFSIYVSLILLATAISSPFFTVYMLKNLSFSYVNYTFIVIGSMISGLVFVSGWGKFADSHGNIFALKLTGFLIPLVPLLYALTYFMQKYSVKTSYIVLYLILAEAFSAFVWAGFNLTSANFVFDAVTRQRTPICVSYFNILKGLGTFFGASLGTFIVKNNYSFFSFDVLLFVFLISALARFLVPLLMFRWFHEVREVKKFGVKDAKDILMKPLFFVFRK